MAVSGLFFVGFVFTHMYGNLKAFAGHEAFNEYAQHLREMFVPFLPYAGFLWIVRIGLIISLIVHVYCGMKLWARANKARDVKYQVKKHTGAMTASLMMRWAGLAIGLFLIWHLLHFTIMKINPTGGQTQDPYILLVDSFSVWWMTLIYLAALAMLGAHLHHGIWAATQTLGWTISARSRQLARRFALTFALIITLGFSAVPVGVLVGIIKK